MSRIALPILLIAEFIIVLLLQWRPDIEARLDPSQFRAEGEYAYFTLVPPIAPRLRKLPSDGPGSRESGLLLLRDGKLLGPAHSDWSLVRRKGAGAYVHWGGALIFSTPGNVDPRTDGAAYTLRTPVVWNNTPHVVLLALALLGAILIARELSKYERVRWIAARAGRGALRMWRNPLAGRFGLTLSTIALAAAIVMMAQWRPLVVATLDPAQIVPERGHLFQVRVSRLAPDGYQIGGDDVPRRFRSDVTVTRDGTPLGPGHANHDDIRQTGGGAFGVWSGVLFFSTPDNTDPRTDGAVYSIAARAQPLPQTAAFVLLIAVGFAALSLLSPTARGLVRLAGLRSRSMPARVLLALVAAGAVGLHMTDNWDEYVNSPDSFGYFSNAFVEASYRQPGVYLWHRIFSDPEAIKTMLPQTPTNVPLTAGPRDPILPGIRAQRVLLAVGFAVITYAMGYLIGPIAALLISLCLVSVESMSAAAAEVAIATALIGLIAIWRGSRLRFEKEEPVATPAGPAKPDALARLPGRVISLLGLGLTVYSFFPAIFANSFFSQEDIWLGSDALATGWTLLFVAALMWFLHARAATALLLCAVLAAFAFLTRPGSIFVVVLFAGLCPLALSVNWRRFLVPVIASTGIAVMLINSVALYGLLSGRRDAGVLNLQTAVVIGFALSIAQPEDEKIFADDVERRFFRAAMARREAALGRVAADDPAAKWSGIVEIYYQAAWSAASEVLGNTGMERANALFLRVTRALALHRPLAYGQLILENLAVGAGVSHYSITRLFHSYADWIVLLALIALTLWGPLRDRTVGLIATFLVAGHFGYLLTAALTVTPTGRYPQSTEWMVVAAILLMVMRQVELIFLFNRPRRDRAEALPDDRHGALVCPIARGRST